MSLARGLFFFFFQAEDGIRDVAVTGVQTCALPIWSRTALRRAPEPLPWIKRTLGRPARNASSRYFSTASRASSVVRPSRRSSDEIWRGGGAPPLSPDDARREGAPPPPPPPPTPPPGRGAPRRPPHL